MPIVQNGYNRVCTAALSSRRRFRESGAVEALLPFLRSGANTHVSLKLVALVARCRTICGRLLQAELRVARPACMELRRFPGAIARRAHVVYAATQAARSGTLQLIAANLTMCPSGPLGICFNHSDRCWPAAA